MDDARVVIGFVALAAMLAMACAQDTTPAPEASSINCYACGQSEVNPQADNPGSYCDVTIANNACPKTSKIYNLTCDIMDNMGASEYWIRECPSGVKSCFVAEGRFDGQNPKFRGCAGAKYPHDEKCDRTLQAVQVVAGKKSVDVEVNLCYCNADICNLTPSGAKRTSAAALIPVLTAAFTAFALLR